MIASLIGGQQEKPSQLKIFRPLFLAFLLISCLFAVRTHERLLDQTFLRYKVLVEGKETFRFNAELNGSPVLTRELPQKISLGKNRFRISQPGYVTFVTNFFAWYGKRELGVINLKRATGLLSISTEPTALTIGIVGNEFATNVHNAGRIETEVPTGDYVIDARFKYMEDRKGASVKEGSPTSVRFFPQVGHLEIAGDVQGASFRLSRSDGAQIAKGNVPMTLHDLPVDQYTVEVSHSEHLWRGTVNVQSGVANKIDAQFGYGSISIRSRPPGAEVLWGNGRKLGKTPLTVSELLPGTNEISLSLEGYELALASFTVASMTTNVVETKLFREGFSHSMTHARRAFDMGAYEDAVTLADAAYRLEPSDSSAEKLLKDAKIARGFARAEAYRKVSDYASAIAEVNSVLLVAPGNDQAKALLTELKALSDSKAALEREAQLNLSTNLFKTVVEKTSDAGMYETRKVVTKNGLHDVEKALLRSFSQDPPLKIIHRIWSGKDAFEITAERHVVMTIGGKVKCILVAAQTTPDEIEVLFKILEYKAEAANKFSIGNLINAPVAVTLVPTHSVPGTALGEAASDLQKRIESAVKSKP